MSTTTSTAVVPRAGVERRARLGGDRGMTTAEYAVGTVAACGFAGILFKLLTSDTVVGFLTEVLRRAFGLLG